MHDDEQDGPRTYEVEATTPAGDPRTIEIIDVGEGELSVVIPVNETIALTSDQVETMIDALRRANGGE